MAVRKLLTLIAGAIQELPGGDSIAVALTWLAQGGATDGQVLTWNNGTGAWVPATPSGGGGGGISHATSDGRTWASKDGAWVAVPGYWTSTTEPTAPSGGRVPGDKWMNLTTGQEVTWVYDGNTGQWVNFQASAAWSQITSTDIEVTDASKGIILKAPNGTRYRLKVDNAGAVTATAA